MDGRRYPRPMRPSSMDNFSYPQPYPHVGDNYTCVTHRIRLTAQAAPVVDDAAELGLWRPIVVLIPCVVPHPPGEGRLRLDHPVEVAGTGRCAGKHEESERGSAPTGRTPDVRVSPPTSSPATGNRQPLSGSWWSSGSRRPCSRGRPAGATRACRARSGSPPSTRRRP